MVFMDGNIQTSIRLPRDLHDYLRRRAFELKISQSQLIRDLLEADIVSPELLRPTPEQEGPQPPQ